jgi:hypothetical protein
MVAMFKISASADVGPCCARPPINTNECYFNSVFLNISSFKIIHLDDKRIRNISENFVFNTGLTFNHPIKSIEQAKLITEQQLHREIENISILKCQIINKERENLNGGFLEGFLIFF